MARLSTLERVLLALVALASALSGIANYGSWATTPRFALATIALAGLAWLVSFATEHVAERHGPAITGTLQATLGNLPELFVVAFALQKGELLIAQTALVGSILANALLVLGLVIVVGAHRSPDATMRFGARLPNDAATLMLATVFIIVLLGLSLGAHDAASHHVKAISTVGACALLVVYMTWAIPYVRTPTSDGRRPNVEVPRLGAAASIALLVLAGAASAFASDWFVNALAPAIKQLHLSRAFAGLVIVAIAGNAVEHLSGVVLAWRGQAELAVAVVKGSIAQVAAFLFPVLVLVSLALATTLTFALAPVYIGALALTALLVWQVTKDGQAVAFEGWALLAVYAMVAVIAAFE